MEEDVGGSEGGAGWPNSYWSEGLPVERHLYLEKEAISDAGPLNSQSGPWCVMWPLTPRGGTEVVQRETFQLALSDQHKYICILRWILHSAYFHFRATLHVFIHFKMFKNYCLLLWVTDSSQQPCQWHSVPYWPGVEPHNTGCLPGKTTHFTATHHVRTTTKKQK